MAPYSRCRTVSTRAPGPGRSAQPAAGSSAPRPEQLPDQRGVRVQRGLRGRRCHRVAPAAGGRRRPPARALNTTAPRCLARAAHARASWVLPMPGSPVTSTTIAPLRLRARASSRAANSPSRPTRTGPRSASRRAPVAPPPVQHRGMQPDRLGIGIGAQVLAQPRLHPGIRRQGRAGTPGRLVSPHQPPERHLVVRPGLQRRIRVRHGVVQPPGEVRRLAGHLPGQRDLIVHRRARRLRPGRIRLVGQQPTRNQPERCLGAHARGLRVAVAEPSQTPPAPAQVTSSRSHRSTVSAYPPSERTRLSAPTTFRARLTSTARSAAGSAGGASSQRSSTSRSGCTGAPPSRASRLSSCRAFRLRSSRRSTPSSRNSPRSRAVRPTGTTVSAHAGSMLWLPRSGDAHRHRFVSPLVAAIERKVLA